MGIYTTVNRIIGVKSVEGNLFLILKKKVVSEEIRSLIKKLLLERIALRGVCRVTGVSLPWLLGFIAKEYKQVPEDLGIKIWEC